MNFYKVRLINVFLMELGEVVENVVADIMKGFPKPIPKVMSISGGNNDVRNAVVEEVHKRTGSRIKESSNGVYRIALPYIIRQYDSSFC